MVLPLVRLANDSCHLRHLFPGDIIHAITVPQLGSYLAQYNGTEQRALSLDRHRRAAQRRACYQVSMLSFADRLYPRVLQPCCDSRASRVDDASASSSTQLQCLRRK